MVIATCKALESNQHPHDWFSTQTLTTTKEKQQQ
jgi:hypothetical protein